MEIKESPTQTDLKIKGIYWLLAYVCLRSFLGQEWIDRCISESITCKVEFKICLIQWLNTVIKESFHGVKMAAVVPGFTSAPYAIHPGGKSSLSYP